MLLQGDPSFKRTLIRLLNHKSVQEYSLMVFPFRKFLTDNIKTYGLMGPVNFLENVRLDNLKNVMPAGPFSVTTNAVPYF